MEYIDRDKLPFDFESHFNMEKISSEKIQFAKHYIEDKMGFELDENPLIEFTPISSRSFGYLVAHIVVEYEKYKEKS